MAQFSELWRRGFPAPQDRNAAEKMEKNFEIL